MNIACGEAATVNALYGLIGETLGVSIPPRRGAPRQGDVRHSLADVSRAKEVLGFTPAIGLKEGLRLTAGYYREMYRRAG